MRRLAAVLVAMAILAAAAYATATGRWPWARPVIEAPPAPLATIVVSHDTLHRGESLQRLLVRNGVGDLDLARVLPRLDLRRLRAGVVARFFQPHPDSVPNEVVLRTDADSRLKLTRGAGGWSMHTEEVRWTSSPLVVHASVTSSLYEALELAVPDEWFGAEQRPRLAWALADLFAWQLDFSRDLQGGERVRVLVERQQSDEGEVRVGRILGAELDVRGRTLSAYRYEGSAGVQFYDAAGESLRRAFLRAPVAFRSINSEFAAKRLHPILGILRRHEGTDYGAAPGTPVMAAGDGVVMRAGWGGGYGNLVEIRHANGIETRYGHLRSIAKGIRAGTRVAQGDVIGAVGSTGLASGPHLHYEFRVEGKAKDPRRVEIGSGEPLPAADRPGFEQARDRLHKQLAVGTTPPRAS